MNGQHGVGGLNTRVPNIKCECTFKRVVWDWYYLKSVPAGTGSIQLVPDY